MGKTTIPFALPFIDDEEVEGIVEAVRSGWLTMGPKTVFFEEQLAQYIGVGHVVAVNSCTAALHLSLIALGIEKGDEVITSPYTFAATGNVIAHTGARPILADIERDTYNIDPEQITEHITGKTRAIIPVHFAGQPCDLREIQEIAEDHNLWVIEDAAHAIGAEYAHKKIGTFGDATCFSFYPTKNMTTGEGGAIATEDEKLADRLRKIRLHGLSKDAWRRYSTAGSWYYEIEECGWKYNMTDLQAAIGIPQLKRLNWFIETRRRLAGVYNGALGSYEDIIIPTEKPDRLHVYHLYPILLKTFDRNTFIQEMMQYGINCSVHFIPLHLHPYYQETFGYKPGDFPNAEWVYEQEVSLPLYPGLSDEDVETVLRSIKEVLRNNG